MAAPMVVPSIPSKKSTNVRAERTALRWLVGAAERRAPDLLARALEPLMFRTTRRPQPVWERELLARGTRSSVGGIVTWTFGDGPSVLLVHGWNGRGAQLGALVGPLVKEGFRVVTFDAPGHGASPGSRSSLPEFADATAAVLDGIRPLLGPAHAVIAHSMGGAAVTFAMHERAHDPRGLPARRFVFVAPPIDVRDFLRTFVRVVGGGPDLERALRARIESRFGFRMEDLYAPALARDLDAPLLVVHDEDDQEVPVERGRLLASAWRSAELEVTKGLGHTRILKDPDVVDRIVRFIAR